MARRKVRRISVSHKLSNIKKVKINKIARNICSKEFPACRGMFPECKNLKQKDDGEYIPCDDCKTCIGIHITKEQYGNR